MKKSLATIIITALIPSLAFSAMKEFIRDYTYRAGEADSKISSRRVALSAVRLELLGEIGTYIHSELTIKQNGKNSDVTEHDIKALSAGFVKVETLEEKWDGYEFYIKARLHTDVDQVLKQVEELQSDDQEKQRQRQQLLESQKANAALLKKIALLQKEVAISVNQSPEIIERVAVKYQKAQQELSAQELVIKANIYYLQDNPDYVEAVFWYKKAANYGLANAQYVLGVMREMGQGVKQDDAAAVIWYRQAAKQGLANAQYNLGVMYEMGQGVKQDDAAAVIWYRQAAKQGLANAQYNLGVMYETGQGTKRDNAEAVTWYRQAAKQGLANAQYNLGVMYETGQGVKRDNSEAVSWYRQAANQGLADAQYNLGELFAAGQGVKQDDAAAVIWYRQAANQGHTMAKKQLIELERGIE